MLKKLIKYEFRATGRLMLPLYAAMLLIGILARISFWVLDNDMYWLIELLSGLIVMIFVLSFAAVGFGVLYVTLASFQRGFLSDEGYLTMTLPVSTHKLISAKLITATVWYFATALVMILEGLMLVVSWEDWADIAGGFGDLFRGIGELIRSGNGEVLAHCILFFIEILVLMALGAALISLMGYACMAIGYSFDKNKKLITGACAFAFYFGAQILSFSVMAIFVESNRNISIEQMEASLGQVWPIHLLLLGAVLFTAALCALFYFVTHRFLTRRLNLE